MVSLARSSIDRRDAKHLHPAAHPPLPCYILCTCLSVCLSVSSVLDVCAVIVSISIPSARRASAAPLFHLPAARRQCHQNLFWPTAARRLRVAGGQAAKGKGANECGDRQTQYAMCNGDLRNAANAKPHFSLAFFDGWRWRSS